MSWFETLVLAVVQGLTEFLPVSSDGHLSVARFLVKQWEGPTPSVVGSLFYIVILHVGTLVAIVAYYRREAMRGAMGLLGSLEVEPWYQRPSVTRAGVLAFVAMLPALPVGLFLKDRIEALFESPMAAALGFLVTAAELAVVSRLGEGRKGLAETTWWQALLIGAGQTVAVLPGVSRSGTTIAIALALGFRRSWAVGFSLLIAVPAIAGATLLELKDLKPSSLDLDFVVKVLVGTVVAGLIGYGAIVWLVRVVKGGRLWYFSVYLCLLSATLLTGLLRAEPEPEAAGGSDGQAVESPAISAGLEALEGAARVDLGRAVGG